VPTLTGTPTLLDGIVTGTASPVDQKNANRQPGVLDRKVLTSLNRYGGRKERTRNHCSYGCRRHNGFASTIKHGSLVTLDR
jgi:hypothetical protein